MAVADFKDLVAWQRAMELVAEVYQLTRTFPSDEQFGLTNQLRRAAVSVPSNIAEGQGRGVGKDFCHFLRIANGSRQEAETQIRLAIRLGFVSESAAKTCLDLVAEVGRIVAGLSASVR